MNERTALKAYVEAWAEIQNPELDGRNPHFRSKFASLHATLGVIRRACAAHGIIYAQTLTANDDGSHTISSEIISAEDSEALSSLSVPACATAQDLGKELTYRKRQLAQLDWGITGEEDTDGEGIQGTPQPQQQASDVRQMMINRIMQLRALLSSQGVHEDFSSWALENIGTDDMAQMDSSALEAFGRHLSSLAQN